MYEDRRTVLRQWINNIACWRTKKMFYSSLIFIFHWRQNSDKCFHHLVSNQNLNRKWFQYLKHLRMQDMLSLQDRLWLGHISLFYLYSDLILYKLLVIIISYNLYDISNIVRECPFVKLYQRSFQYMGRWAKSSLQFAKNSCWIKRWTDPCPRTVWWRRQTDDLRTNIVGWTEKRRLISSRSRIFLEMGMEC